MPVAFRWREGGGDGVKKSVYVGSNVKLETMLELLVTLQRQNREGHQDYLRRSHLKISLGVD